VAPRLRAPLRRPARHRPRAQRRPPRRPAAEPAALDELDRLDEITRRLRRECPWDREQDERSIVPHTVEEAYELADAAQRGDDEKLRDELGDVLFQVVFLSLLLEERDAGSFPEVAAQLTEKLIRRHPHVFGDAEAESSREVLRNWDQIKRDVEGRGADIPENLPGLLYARKVLRRAESDGGSPADRATRDEAEAAVGEMLLQAVRLARRLGVDPELAVRAAADRLRDPSR
jgi:XTP/dITP diphosphohydrolase/tetrapyrrole methylase family protein/MazG family protein/ATP diphosphatase